MSTQYDVAIIGYGPVGATLAALLGQDGLNVLVIEKEKDIFPLPRAIHFDGEVMRTFQKLHLKEQVLKISRPGIQGMHFVNAKGETLLVRGGSSENGPNGCANNYYFHQPELEKILRQKVQQFTNVTVLTETELVELHEHENLSLLKTKHRNELTTKEFQARYVVGCDGARSFVRATMGSPMEDLGLKQQWLVFDVILKHHVNLPAYTVQHCDPNRPMTYCNVVDNRRRWEIMVMPDDNLEELVKPERIWSLVEPWANPEVADLERAAIYTFHSLIAQGWRKGRLLLAGDAAHQTPPFLGQGLCAGIRDAANLHWKLTAIIHNKADDSLLDSYESERSPHVHEVIGLAVYLGSIIQTTDKEKARQRDEKFRLDDAKEFTMPIAKLGKGFWDESSQDGGHLFFQAQLTPETYLDDVIGNHYALIASDTLNLADDETQQILNMKEITLLHTDHKDINLWLNQRDLKFVVLRPDRYILSAGKNKAQLDTVLSLVA